MACLRSFSRRSLYPKWFCCKILTPDVLHKQHVRDYAESSFPDSSLLIRRFHRHVLLDERKKTAFGSTSEGSSGLLLCRHLSSKPEELHSKIDAFGNVIEEVVSEKTVEAIATNVSTAETEKLVEYVINGIHELTGFNWWISIVLTAFLVNVLMSPVSVRVLLRAWELKNLMKTLLNVNKIIQVSEHHSRLAKYKKWEAELMEKSEEVCLNLTTLFTLDGMIYACFIHGISTMAKNIPELSTSDSLYILPLVTGFTFWLSSEINTSGSNLVTRMKRLPLFPIFFITIQAIYEYEPAVYFYVIPSRICICTLVLMLKSNRIVKMRRILGWPDVPVTKVSDQQRVMARVINLMREFTDVVKKKDKK